MAVSTIKAQEELWVSSTAGGRVCGVNCSQGRKLGILTLQFRNWCAGELQNSRQRGMRGSKGSPGEAELIHFRETEACARDLFLSCRELANKRCLLTLCLERHLRHFRP